MTFDHTKINLPFHPGDPLWKVDEENGYKVEKTTDKIIGVLITEDNIRIIRNMLNVEDEMDFVTVEPNEFPSYFLSEKDAKEYAKRFCEIREATETEREEE